MFKYLIFLYVLFLNSLSTFGQSQNIKAVYKVTKIVYCTDINGNRKEVTSLQYTGFLYQKNNRTIYYQKPLYLKEYPDGNVHIAVNANYQMLIGLPMDTLQHVYYMDYDSLITRSRTELPGATNKEWNVKQPFKRGGMTWKFFPDTKEVNGLKCQKATFTALDGRLIYEVWFCSDIPVLAGPFTIRGLPGLGVQAVCPVLDETYTLESYNTNISPPDSILWPDVFNQPFR